MEMNQIINGVIFCLTITSGICSNILILLILSCIAYKERKMMPSETILSTLSAANLLLLFTLGLPDCLLIFGVKYFYSDLGCKFDAHFMRSSRVMIIGLTSLLSCFQGATLASANPMWAIIKAKMQKYLMLLIALIVTLSTVSSLSSALYPVVSTNTTDQTRTVNLGFCFSIYPNAFLFALIGNISFARDVTFVALMALASTYILVTLRKHGKQMKGKRSSDRNQENSAEQQAAKMVVTFVTIYVLIFGTENLIWIYQVLVAEENNIALNVTKVYLQFCFSTAFPFVLIAFNKKVRSATERALNVRTHATGKDGRTLASALLPSMSGAQPGTTPSADPAVPVPSGPPSLQQDLSSPSSSQEDLPGGSDSGTVGTVAPDVSISSESDNDDG
ncbi:olfactory receptor class A-like protein 1 [Protopterus annectens]|uniref:olfactory receptor class A-like protein 1 n=1 Tax=Protopterus annectens TaxID=7888 RepID=UPI001CFBBE3F|nr:olfactory receptor class A-like protein 1 [Protopterus annectens]